MNSNIRTTVYSNNQSVANLRESVESFNERISENVKSVRDNSLEDASQGSMEHKKSISEFNIENVRFELPDAPEIKSHVIKPIENDEDYFKKKIKNKI